MVGEQLAVVSRARFLPDGARVSTTIELHDGGHDGVDEAGAAALTKKVLYCDTTTVYDLTDRVAV